MKLNDYSKDELNELGEALFNIARTKKVNREDRYTLCQSGNILIELGNVIEGVQSASKFVLAILESSDTFKEIVKDISKEAIYEEEKAKANEYKEY